MIPQDPNNRVFGSEVHAFDMDPSRCTGLIADMHGKTIKAVSVSNGDDAAVIFDFEDGTRAAFFHSQDCCEAVWLATETGDDPRSLIGQHIVHAYVGEHENSDRCSTAYFYHIRCRARDVTLVWRGRSNGYYSTDVRYIIGPRKPREWYEL